MRDLLDLAVKYRIRIPKEYALLSRASVSTEGMLRSLYPEMNILEVALPYAKELLADRYDPSQLQGGLMRTLLRFQSLATDLPTQLSQILLDLESGKFTRDGAGGAVRQAERQPAQRGDRRCSWGCARAASSWARSSRSRRRRGCTTACRCWACSGIALAAALFGAVVHLVPVRQAGSGRCA